MPRVSPLYRALTMPTRPVGMGLRGAGRALSSLAPSVMPMVDKYLDDPEVNKQLQNWGGQLAEALPSQIGGGKGGSLTGMLQKGAPMLARMAPRVGAAFGSEGLAGLGSLMGGEDDTLGPETRRQNIMMSMQLPPQGGMGSAQEAGTDTAPPSMGGGGADYGEKGGLMRALGPNAFAVMGRGDVDGDAGGGVKGLPGNEFTLEDSTAAFGDGFPGTPDYSGGGGGKMGRVMRGEQPASGWDPAPNYADGSDGRLGRVLRGTDSAPKPPPAHEIGHGNGTGSTMASGVVGSFNPMAGKLAGMAAGTAEDIYGAGGATARRAQSEVGSALGGLGQALAAMDAPRGHSASETFAQAGGRMRFGDAGAVGAAGPTMGAPDLLGALQRSSQNSVTFSPEYHGEGRMGRLMRGEDVSPGYHGEGRMGRLMRGDDVSPGYHGGGKMGRMMRGTDSPSTPDYSGGGGGKMGRMMRGEQPGPGFTMDAGGMRPMPYGEAQAPEPRMGTSATLLQDALKRPQIDLPDVTGQDQLGKARRAMRGYYQNRGE